MKRTLVALIALVIAAPVVTVPIASEAQVLTGRGSAPRSVRRPARPAPPPLSEAEEDRLFEAESQILDLDRQIAELEQAGAAQGGLSDPQRTQLQSLSATRSDAAEVVERLEAKRDRAR